MVCTQAVAVALAASSVSAFSAAEGNIRSRSLQEFSQQFLDAYNPAKMYGGNGPWSHGIGFGISRDPPTGCEVDQMTMIHRHGERYPDPDSRQNMLNSLAKIYGSNVTTFRGDLAFLNHWQSYLDDECLSGMETFSGPYAGLLSGFTHGNWFRQRYGHLWDGQSVVPIFASGYERIIETARRFGEGFFAYNYTTNAAINIISEDDSQGVDSLTPACDIDLDQGTCNSLTNLMPQFDVAAARFNRQNPGLSLNATDIYNLMQMSAFELNTRAFSSWMGAFTNEEWLSYGHTQNLQYWYCAGPGDQNMNAVGAVFVNATITRLNEAESENPLSLNFAHDTNITPIIGLLGLFNPSENLPLNTVPFGNPWSTGNIVPQSGHLVVERLQCNDTAISKAGKFVRFVVNEAVIPWPVDQSGPGYSTSLEMFTSTVLQDLPNYVQACQVPKDYPQYLDFWWNYNTTTELNFRTTPIGCALGTASD